MKRRYATLDVFTDTRLAGNPLAVVLDCEGLEGAQMQAIAREFNLSETVFVLPAQNPAHTARLRIFTPGSELPFAGHPTIGAAIFLAAQKNGGRDSSGRDSGSRDSESDAIIVLEEEIGPVRAGVRFRRGQAPFAEFDLPVFSKRIGDAPDINRLCTALGLTHGEIGFENHKASMWTAGVSFVFVPVRDLEAIGKIELNLGAWRECFTGFAGEVVVYCRESVHQDSQFHARMFAPAIGVHEDPATGAAAAAFSGVIQHFDDLHDGTHRFNIEQGFEMGRPSLISIEIEVAAGKTRAARIGGNAVFISEGVMEV